MLTMADLDRIEEEARTCLPGADEVADLVKMARRYQWLRDQSQWANLGTPTVISYCAPQASSLVLDGEKLDQAIDSAINSQRKEGGEG